MGVRRHEDVEGHEGRTVDGDGGSGRLALAACGRATAELGQPDAVGELLTAAESDEGGEATNH